MKKFAIWNRMGNAVTPLKPGRTGLIAIYLVFAAVAARTVAYEMPASLVRSYLGGEFGFILLFSLVLWRTRFPQWLMHLYFVTQCGLVFWLLSLWPDFDFVTVLFFLLSYQAAVFFRGRVCWTWVLIIVLLTGGSLIFYYGLFGGLGLALTTMAAEIVIPAYVIVNEETEVARMKSQALVKELGETHQQLQQYSGQVESLAAMQERNQLARTLHDSVSQMMFSIALTNRAAASLLEKDPDRARSEITRLQAMTAEALKQLRSLITEMRPPSQESSKNIDSQDARTQ